MYIYTYIYTHTRTHTHAHTHPPFRTSSSTSIDAAKCLTAHALKASAHPRLSSKLECSVSTNIFCNPIRTKRVSAAAANTAPVENTNILNYSLFVLYIFMDSFYAAPLCHRRKHHAC